MIACEINDVIGHGQMLWAAICRAACLLKHLASQFSMNLNIGLVYSLGVEIPEVYGLYAVHDQ